MDIIGKLIELALIAASDLCVIGWYPGEDGAPESYEAECEIELNCYPYSADFQVFLGNVFCLIDARHLECWHASKLEMEM